MKDLKILVPIDFSDLSLNAFPAAQKLVSMFGGTITPFHSVVELWKGVGFYNQPGPSSSIDYNVIEEQAKSRLNDLAAQYVDEHNLKPAIVKTGLPATRILESAEDYDLIVMSSHGHSGFKRIILGSVTEEVLKLVKTPLLVVEKNQNLDSIRKILLTTDFSDSSIAAFPWALNIAKATEAKIVLAHVLSLGPFFEVGSTQMLDRFEPNFIDVSNEKLERLIDDYFYEISDRVKPKLITTHRSIHEALYKMVKDDSYSMVVMSSLGHTGLKFLMLGSTAIHLTRHVHVPVLVIHSD